MKSVYKVPCLRYANQIKCSFTNCKLRFYLTSQALTSNFLIQTSTTKKKDMTTNNQSILTPAGSHIVNPSFSWGIQPNPKTLFGDLFGSANKMTNRLTLTIIK